MTCYYLNTTETLTLPAGVDTVLLCELWHSASFTQSRAEAVPGEENIILIGRADVLLPELGLA